MRRISAWSFFLVVFLSMSLSATGLRASDSGLAEVLSVSNQAAGELVVTSTLPQDGSDDIGTDALITVVFNRPIVPLTTIGASAELPSPITITPKVEGVGEWLNTSIYTFRATPALAGGTPYTVTVNPELTAIDGSALAEPYSFGFTTAAPAVTGFLPDSMTTVQLDQTVQVTFSAPVDRASAEAAFSLHVAGEDNQATGDPLPGKFRWADDSTGFQFTPDATLALGTNYRAEIAGGQITSPGGGAPMAQPAARVFSTVPLPAILSTDPFEGETDVPIYTGFGIYFASQMDVASLREKVTIDPEPVGTVDSYYDSYSNQYRLSFGMEPSAEYTITIAPGMEDIYGNAIESELAVQFTTAPYDPSVALQTPGDMGFYNAHNERTELFVAHRNVDSINFTLDAVPDSALVSAFQSDPYYGGYNIVSGLDTADLERLRAWTLQSEAPHNALRYDLLSLGSAAPVTCTGAPATQLAVGDVAEVISDPDPVRARETPVDGEIVTLLYKGYALPVIGGPLCEGDALWWEVQLRDGQTAWVAEGIGDEYFLGVQSKGEQTPIVFEGSKALAPGMYLIGVSSPDLPAYGNMQHLLFVSTAVLTMKTAPDEVVVWATDVQTGQPIPDAPITIFDAKLGEVGSGVTDADGLLRVSVPRAEDYQARMAVLDDGGQFGVSMSTWSNGIEPYSFGAPFNPQPAPFNAYLYTDRPIYRPEQPVYFRGVLRAADDAQYTPSGEESVQIGIYEQNSGELLYSEKLPLTAFGTFNGEYHIAADAPLGYYRIAVQLPHEDGLTPYGEAGISFGVAEYRAPEFQVTVTPNAAEVAQGDTITALVEARYFFGGAVSGGTV
ncbi:MAG: Ig-like domain-containing protein, partial [Anaerolineae bacterium]|nr:Ig-like domain-containing protein [Anaerolineae bacterium]